jgi:uncharacterized membrane protein YphA (DoxX/SURF4 family)
MKKNTDIKLRGLPLYAFTILRIVIGWHFLFEGLSKLYTPGWSSADFMLLSNWIFSGFFHTIAENSSLLAAIDFLVVWGLIGIGSLLFVGILERIAIIGGMILLSMFWLANPPLTGLDFGIPSEGNYLIVDKNLVEFFALLVLFLFPTGKQLGIDVFLSANKEHFSRSSDSIKDRTIPQSPEDKNVKVSSRRNVIKGLSVLPFLIVFGFAFWKRKKWESYEERNLVDAATGASSRTLNTASLKELKQTVPFAKIGDKTFSRIILGGNLLSGYAHSRDLIYVSQLVKAYHQKDKIFATLLLSEKCGINTLLTNPILCTIIDEYWRRGIGKIQFISDCTGLNYDSKGKSSPMPFKEYLEKVKRAIDMGATACYIQGETADHYIGEGKVDEIAKVLDLIRENGLLTGIGAHRIETIKACVKSGFRPDFWMKTMHHHNYWSARNPDWNDNIFCYNPEETIRYLKELKEPVIGFKVMAAGAIPPIDAFRYAFENGADFICAGMYDFQIVEDVNIACDILGSNIKRERPWYA